MYDGNVYVVGRTYGALPTQTKTSLLEDAFIRKYDASGSELWTRQFGGDSYHGASGVAVERVSM